MKRELIIGSTVINDESDCYVIAELGHNHGGNLETAKEMIRQVAACGASAVKLQKRDNRSLFTRAAYRQPYHSENAYGPTYGAHREALELGLTEYETLQIVAGLNGVDVFATAFDQPSADMLAGLGVPAFKIASGDLTNIPLLKHVAGFGKPVIISTGGGTVADVERVLNAVWPINQQLALLHCTAAYPVAWEEMNLKVIQNWRTYWPEITIGLSAHDNGIAMSVAAYTLGARIIEKHFTLNRASKGTDHAFSLEPAGLRKLVRDLKRTRLALGDGRKVRYPSEEAPLLKMSKSLVVAGDLPAGHVLTAEDIAAKSPGGGLPPYEIDRLIGKALTMPLAEDDWLAMALVEWPEKVTA